MKTEFVVMSSCAHMPNSCWGTYRRVALVEVVAGAKPKMISDRARGVVRVVQTWERLSVGSTARCAYRRALAEAEQLHQQVDPEGYAAINTARRLAPKQGR